MINYPSIKYITNHPELGQSPASGFDCSGFVSFVLAEAGLHIPDFIGQDNVRRPIRHASEFWDHYGVAVHDKLQQPGDLIFFSRHGFLPTHIGIVRDAESYIHAPGKNNTKVEVAPITHTILAANSLYRQLYARNPIGFKSPAMAALVPTYRYHQRVV